MMKTDDLDLEYEAEIAENLSDIRKLPALDEFISVYRRHLKMYESWCMEDDDGTHEFLLRQAAECLCNVDVVNAVVEFQGYDHLDEFKYVAHAWRCTDSSDKRRCVNE